ncbi:MAG: sigma-70 family RNA polymerase sigma factor [Proteobacteria bacterium]|nr:sigma-70 family RNA polymerase sigma factor [Pseudomonadota bacterium]
MLFDSSAVDDAEAAEYIGISDPQDVGASETELLKCLRAGEERCFETLVRQLGPQVLATAKRYLRSDAEAGDCFQDTFLAVFEGINKFEQRSSLRTWVQGITINQCLMRIRKQARRQEESIEHLLPIFDENGDRIETTAIIQSPAISESIDTTRLKSIVREKINELPDDYRLVLLLRDIDGYTTKETAAILRIKINAVKTRLHRARSALKSLLTPVLAYGV